MSATVIPGFMPRSRTSCCGSPAASRSFSPRQIGLTISATGRSGFGKAPAGAPEGAIKSCAALRMVAANGHVATATPKMVKNSRRLILVHAPRPRGQKHQKGDAVEHTRLAGCHSLFGEFLYHLRVFGKMRQSHATQDVRRLRELNIVVTNDLDAIAPRVTEVEEGSGQSRYTGLGQCLANGFLVVDNQAEVAPAI